MKIIIFLTGLILVLFSACKTEVEKESNSLLSEADSKKQAPGNLQNAIRAIEPFFKPMGEPEPGEWLASFKEEGQTFEQYINGNPTLPTEKRGIIYIQPIGKFNNEQRKIIKLTAEYMENFFNLRVKMLEEKKFDEPLSMANHRIHPQWKTKQIRTGYILDNILTPNLPEDAAAMIAFTGEDLYPDETMNFVFGQANLQNRTGVWSLYWLNYQADFETFLKRTLKIAVHETGHMFSIYHCTKYECVMSGSNHLDETDKYPIDACPECMAKVCWLSKSEPQIRYKNLGEFCRKNGLKEEADVFLKKGKAVSKH